MKTWRVAICVMLIVCVLTMSLSVLAVETTPSPTPELDEGLGNINDEMMSRYIWLCLRAWGINIKFGDIDTFYDAVENQIIDWVIQYLFTLPSAHTISQWIAPWQGDFDYWGNLRLNSSALEDIQDFASWLIGEYDLTDNTDTEIDPIYALDNLNLYQLGKYYPAVRADNNEIGMYIKVSANLMNNVDTSGLYYFVALVGNIYYFVVVSQRQLTSTGIQSFGMLANGSEEYRSTSNISFASGDVNINGVYQGVYKRIDAPAGYGNYTGQFIPQDAIVGVFQDNSQLQSFLQNCNLVIDSNGSIVTTSIVLPENSPTYVEGDAITIIDGEPEYSVIESNNVTVDNLPAIITQRNIPDIGNDEENPGFSVPWQAINGLIQYVAAPAGAILALVNEAPVEGVIMLYALIGGIIIFGMIRIMREH